MPLHSLIFFTLLFAACSYALIRGGRPEQLVALTMLAGVFATRLTMSALQNRYRGVEWPMMTVDLTILAVFVGIALRADRRWPFLLVGIHALSVAAHAAKIIDTHLIRTVYWMLTNLWIYPQLALLAIGTWGHQRRISRRGSDTDWSRFTGA